MKKIPDKIKGNLNGEIKYNKKELNLFPVSMVERRIVMKSSTKRRQILLTTRPPFYLPLDFLSLESFSIFF